MFTFLLICIVASASAAHLSNIEFSNKLHDDIDQHPMDGEITVEELLAFLKFYDEDGSGTISLTELKKHWNGLVSDGRIEELFKHMNLGKIGNQNELDQIDMVEVLDVMDVETVINHPDYFHNGRIESQELRIFVLSIMDNYVGP